MNLSHLAEATLALKARSDTRPLEYVRWTPPQLRFLSDPAPVKLLRGGNQVGKSWAGIGEMIYRCTGTHPYLETREPPIEAWLITYSAEQSVSVAQKLWELLPKDQLTPDTEWIPGKGFRGRQQVVKFKNGSIIRIKTTGGSTSLNLASATIDLAIIDEPPPQAIWGELAARVLRRQGVIGLCMTPLGRRCGWLRKLAEDGAISDHPAPLTVENLTVEGGLSPMLSQEQIDEIAGRYLAIDRDARLLGAWECISPDRCFDAFDDRHISPTMPPGGRQLNVCIGMDHGADAGSECAVLTVIDRTDSEPRIWILDEYVAGAAEPSVHAQGLIAMLARNQLEWRHLDLVVGDRGYGGKRWGGKMSNSRILRALEAHLHVGSGQLRPGIRTAWKPRGSVYTGSSVLHSAMVRDACFSVHPRCKETIRSLRHHRMVDDDTKHLCDAARYSLELLTRQRLYAPNALKMY